MDFAVGQKWRFKGVAVDAEATLGIGLIIDDPLPKGAAIHIWVEGLGGLKPELHGGVANISHTPICREALAKSVTTLVAEGVPVPSSFEQDYESWLTTEGAGVWTTTLEAIVAYVRKAMTDHLAQQQKQPK